MPEPRYRLPAASSWMRAALEQKPGARGYTKRPMTKVVRAIRAALYDLYDLKTEHQLGATEVEIHNYMAEVAGTFLPIEFEDGVMYLVRAGQVATDDRQKDQRYRLTPEGHFVEEDARLTTVQRWGRDLKREFGTRLFWLIAGAAIVTAQRLIAP